MISILIAFQTPDLFKSIFCFFKNFDIDDIQDLVDSEILQLTYKITVCGSQKLSNSAIPDVQDNIFAICTF